MEENLNENVLAELAKIGSEDNINGRGILTALSAITAISLASVEGSMLFSCSGNSEHCG